MKNPFEIFITTRSFDKYKNAIEILKSENLKTEWIHNLIVDFQSSDQIQNLIKEIKTNKICIDVLVNNAGAFSW